MDTYKVIHTAYGHDDLAKEGSFAGSADGSILDFSKDSLHDFPFD